MTSKRPIPYLFGVTRRRIDLPFIAGLLGATCVVVGLVIAWRRQDATSVLITGAVLIAITGIAPHWRQLTLKWRDVTATVERGEALTAAAAAKVEELARESNGNDDREEFRELRVILEQLRGAVGSLATERYRSPPHFYVPVAFHVRQPDAVDLMFIRPPAHTYSVTCTVRGPQGNFTVGGSHVLHREPVARMVFPQDFGAAKDLKDVRPGTYSVDWRFEATLDGNPVAAHDEFVVT